VFRLLQEDRVRTHSHFITLTYAPHFLPRSPNNLPTLNKRHLQLYWKRLRKNTGYDISYYAVGEYGSLYRRPHYHAIVFGCPTPVSYSLCWTVDYNPIGSVDCGPVNANTIAYCAGYLNKGKTVPRHARDDREREFSVMSNGLGAAYLSDNIVRYHKSHLDQLYVTHPGGRRVAMPKYYRDQIFTEEEKAKQREFVLHAYEKRELKLRKRAEKEGFNYSDWCEMHRKHRLYVQKQKNRYKRNGIPV
jgi:hypothetical protein